MQDILPADKWKDSIRKRPAMYTGDLRLTGFWNMLEYLFEDILEDCLENPTLEIDFFPRNEIAIRITNVDTSKTILRIEDLRAADNRITGLSFLVLITLSSTISIAINDVPSLVVLRGEKGDFGVATSTSQEKEKSVVIGFTPNSEIFKDLELSYESINSLLRQFAFLNPGLKLISADKTTDELQRNVFYYPTGVFKELDHYISLQPYSTPLLRINIDAQIGGFVYKIGISYQAVWFEQSRIRTYAGNIETFRGGSLNEGILDGLILSIKKAAQKENVGVTISKKLVKEQFVIIAAVRGEGFVYGGSTKWKLEMPKIRKDVKHLVCQQMGSYLDSNPAVKDDILRRFERWED